MANAVGLLIENQGIEGEPPVIRMQYSVFFVDNVLGIAEATSVAFAVNPDTTPQQFRTAFTNAILAKAAEQFPAMSITAGDCVIDVMQRGN